MTEEAKDRIKKWQFSDYDDDKLLTTDGYANETVHNNEETDDEESLPLDEGAVMALSIEEIKYMRRMTMDDIEITEVSVKSLCLTSTDKAKSEKALSEVDTGDVGSTNDLNYEDEEDYPHLNELEM